jgi:hypothetical protein
MLMRGIQPPTLGTVRDRVMTEMFAIERQLEQENFKTISLVMSVLLGADKSRLETVFKILTDQSEKLTYRHWSVEKKQEEALRVRSDLDILQRLNRLSPSKE